MAFLWKYFFSPIVGKPTNGFVSRYVLPKLFERKNKETILKTVEALKIRPNENVVEFGFGYGIGLKHAMDTSGLRKGTGVLYGVDHSSATCDFVRKLLDDDISKEKVKILNESVSKMSIADSSIDKVFHVNCYYYWDMDTAPNEVLRIMKPGGLILAGMNYATMKWAVSRGILKDWRIPPERYMDGLRQVGFLDIKCEAVHKNEVETTLLIISATKPKVVSD